MLYRPMTPTGQRPALPASAMQRHRLVSLRLLVSLYDISLVMPHMSGRLEESGGHGQNSGVHRQGDRSDLCIQLLPAADSVSV